MNRIAATIACAMLAPALMIGAMLSLASGCRRPAPPATQAAPMAATQPTSQPTTAADAQQTTEPASADQTLSPPNASIEKLADGQYRYTVHGLEVSRIPAKELPKLEKLLSESIEGKVVFDLSARTMTVTTRQPPAEFEESCDEAARGCGIMPYWLEQETRNRRSPRFAADAYKPLDVPDYSFSDAALDKIESHHSDQWLQTEGSEVHVMHLTLRVDSDGASITNGPDATLSFSKGRLDIRCEDNRLCKLTPYDSIQRACTIQIAPGREGIVQVSRVTAECMCNDMLVVRVFDSDG